MKKLGQRLFEFYLIIVLVWIIFALSFQLTFVYLHFTDQDDTIRTITNTLDRSLDGRFRTK